jgi:hypothetical protein
LLPAITQAHLTRLTAERSRTSSAAIRRTKPGPSGLVAEDRDGRRDGEHHHHMPLVVVADDLVRRGRVVVRQRGAVQRDRVEPQLLRGLPLRLDHGTEPRPEPYGFMPGWVVAHDDLTEPMEGWEMLED